jgi:hypothetical protein
MTYQKISKVLTPEEHDALKGAVEALDGLVTAFAVNLSTLERKRLKMLGPRRQAFVEACYNYANTNSDLVPPFLDMVEFQKDWDLFHQLRDLHKSLDTVEEKFTDTYMAAGSEALAHARLFYSAVKAAEKSGKPGTEAIVDDLRGLYNTATNRPEPTEYTPVPVTGDTAAATDTSSTAI